MALDTAPTIAPYDAPVKDLYEIGEMPPLGHVPANMYAWCIRQERHGPAKQHAEHIQQLRAQLRLQLFDLCRERGLRNVEAACRAREAAGFDHGDEIAQVAEFHGRLYRFARHIR